MVDYKKILIFCSILIIVIISFKPLVFFTRYLSAKYWIHVKKNQSKADYFTLQAVHYHPPYSHNSGLEDSRLKAAVFFNKTELLKEGDKVNVPRLKQIYRDNFYIQNFLNSRYMNANWEHLDKLSYFFLSRAWANPLTKKVLTRLRPRFSGLFLENLLDFLNWQGNDDLIWYIKDEFNISNHSFLKPEKGIEYQYSLDCMRKTIAKEFGIEKNRIGTNNIVTPDFNDEDQIEIYWLFSKMFDKKPFGKGAFYFNRDRIGNNRVFRGFNLYINNPKNCTPGRGGIWYQREIKLLKGYYVFAFDYWLKYGHEKPSFWLSRSIKELLLDPEKGKWKKVIFIFNNEPGKMGQVFPLIRMYGKGSFWFDNVFLGKIEGGNIEFPESGWHTFVSLEPE